MCLGLTLYLAGPGDEDGAGRLWWRCGLKTYFYLRLNQRTHSDKKPEGERERVLQRSAEVLGSGSPGGPGGKPVHSEEGGGADGSKQRPVLGGESSEGVVWDATLSPVPANRISSQASLLEAAHFPRI